MNQTLKRTLYIGTMAIVCLLAVYGYASGETPLSVVHGSEYVQTEISGAFYEVTLPDGSAVSLFPDESSQFPSLYRDTRNNDFSGMNVKSGAYDCVLYPARSSTVFPVMRVEKGSSLTLRLWNAQGEIGILNEENPSLVIAQRPSESGSAVTGVTRSAFDGKKLTGKCTLYASANKKVLLTGNGLDIDAALNDAVIIASVSWTYEAATRKLTATAAGADGKSTDISYYAFVDNVILMSGRNTDKASGVIKASSDDDIWHLRVVFPDGLVFQTPEYRMDGTIHTLSSGVSLMTEAEAEAAASPASVPQPTPTPVPEVLVTPAPTAEPENAEPLPESPVPSAESPAVVSPQTSVLFRSEGEPAFTVRVENNSFTLTLSGIPHGWTLNCVRLVQKLESDSMSAAMQNAYSSEATFSVENANSTVTLTIMLENSQGETMKIPAGTYACRVDG